MIIPQTYTECGQCPHPGLCVFKDACQHEVATFRKPLTVPDAFEAGRQSVLQELVDARHTVDTNERLRAMAQKGPLTLVWANEADWVDAQLKRAARLYNTKELP